MHQRALATMDTNTFLHQQSGGTSSPPPPVKPAKAAGRPRLTHEEKEAARVRRLENGRILDAARRDHNKANAERVTVLEGQVMQLRDEIQANGARSDLERARAARGVALLEDQVRQLRDKLLDSERVKEQLREQLREKHILLRSEKQKVEDLHYALGARIGAAHVAEADSLQRIVALQARLALISTRLARRDKVAAPRGTPTSLGQLSRQKVTLAGAIAHEQDCQAAGLEHLELERPADNADRALQDTVRSQATLIAGLQS